jgi:hypothetical protein
LKKIEDQNNKMAEKASILAMDEMKGMLANHEKGMEERLVEQAQKYEEELNAFKKLQMATNNLFTHKSPTMVNNYKVAEQYKSTTKACDIIFDGKPENWPTFKGHLIKEAEHPTIGWSKDTLGFQLVEDGQEINLLET